MSSEKILIKEIDAEEDFKECVKIQQELVQLNEVGIVPAYLLKLIGENGGLTLGCYLNEKLLGFNFSFSAYSNKDGYYLFSDTMGFYRSYQRKSLGYLVKQVQFQLALEKGASKVIWTYDPLLGPNANINIRKVGGIVHHYEMDKYSDVTYSKGVSIPADRFILDWQIQSKRVQSRILEDHIHGSLLPESFQKVFASRTIPVIYHSSHQKIHFEFREITDLYFLPEEPVVLIEIPYEFQDIKDKIPELAFDWRIKTRRLFQFYLNTHHYKVIDFYQLEENDEMRNFYVLAKLPLEQILESDF